MHRIPERTYVTLRLLVRHPGRDRRRLAQWDVRGWRVPPRQAAAPRIAAAPGVAARPGITAAPGIAAAPRVPAAPRITIAPRETLAPRITARPGIAVGVERVAPARAAHVHDVVVAVLVLVGGAAEMHRAGEVGIDVEPAVRATRLRAIDGVERVDETRALLKH